MNAHGRWLASIGSLAVIALSSGCEEHERDYVAPISAGPHRTLGDGGTADSGPGSSGFVPRPGSSATGTTPGSGAVSALSDDEITALCDELDARFRARISDEDAVRFACNLLAVQSSISTDPDGTTLLDPSACRAATTSCLASGASADRAVDCDVLAGAVAGCELNVAAFEGCFDAQVESIADAVDRLECAQLSSSAEVDDVLASLDAARLPACETIAAMCPALLPSGDGRRGVMSPKADGCDDDCLYARDGRCDDGGDDSDSDQCAFGSDCADCGPR
jgi:hypothetical protein